MVGICILSGTFSLVREAFSSFRLFSNRDLEIADFVRTHTSPQAIFLTSDFHNNPISALAGRNIVMGYEGWLWSHGIDYQERAEDIRALFSNTDQFFDLINKYGIDYMYISSNEKTKYGEGVYQFLKRFPIVYGSQGAVILSLSKESGSSSQSAPFHDSN